MDKVYIFDTTLRDGEQSPGASMSVQDKVRIAHQLEAVRADVIEAGFAVSSPAQFEAIRIIAGEIQEPVIASLARAVDKDIEAAGKAIAAAPRKRIHTFIATSPIHREHKLRMTKDEVLKHAVEAVRYARTFTDDVEFSAEDATRTEIEYLCEVVQAAVEAGATTINIPDTVGYTVPSEFTRIISAVKDRVPNIGKAVISVHCHNDLGLAVANSLAAVQAGARQVEVAVNGLGERAGNASLEEVVMALEVRKNLFNIETGIDTRELYRTSRLVVSVTGIPVQPNKAVVGKNAFSHEAGIHQDGVLKERSTYEIMTPEQIGRPSSEIVLGRHSGKHGLKQRLEELGYTLDEEDFAAIYEKFTEIADKKKAVYDDELIVMLSENAGMKMPDTYRIVQVQIVSGDRAIPTATVELDKAGKTFREASTGNGPVEAIYSAIDRITGMKLKLDDYEVTSISAGQDAMGEVSVAVIHDGRTVHASASDTDILMASAKAYLNAVNKIMSAGK